MKNNYSEKIILIVEDIESNQLLIERSLAKIGVHTIWATNGNDAVSLCREFENINLVLMDLRLPKLDGYEATRQIRTFNKELPIIAQTAYVMPYEKAKVLEVGCTDLITKPFRANDIVNIVVKYL